MPQSTFILLQGSVACQCKDNSLDTTEIPVNSINSISETRSFIEMITGRGSVLVASGIGARHKVRMGEIDIPEPAAALRELVP